MNKTVSKAMVAYRLLSLLAGCGGGSSSTSASMNAQDYIKNKYSLESADGSGSNMQKVYRASGQSVPDVAAKIADQQKPDEMSKSDSDDMFLVYNNDIIHVQQDGEKQSDTLIEVDSKQYVQQHLTRTTCRRS